MPDSLLSTTVPDQSTTRTKRVIRVDDTKNVQLQEEDISLTFTYHLTLDATADVQTHGAETYVGSATLNTSVDGPIDEAAVAFTLGEMNGTANFVLHPRSSSSYDVPPVGMPQGTQHTCWAAGITMMLSWRDCQPYSIPAAMDIAGPEFRNLFDSDRLLYDKDMQSLLEPLDMEVEPTAHYTVGDICDMLQEYGPLMVFLGEDEMGTGIITEATGDGSAVTTQLTFIDAISGTMSVLKDTQSFVDMLNQEIQSHATTMPIVHFKTPTGTWPDREGEGNIAFVTSIQFEGTATAPDANASYTSVGDILDVTVTDEDGSSQTEMALGPIVSQNVPVDVTVVGSKVVVTLSAASTSLSFDGVAEVTCTPQ